MKVNCRSFVCLVCSYLPNMFVFCVQQNIIVLWYVGDIVYIYIRNRSGPNTDPRGTLHSISLVEEDSPLYRTNYLRSLR